jgi:hypothetical protein
VGLRGVHHAALEADGHSRISLRVVGDVSLASTTSDLAPENDGLRNDNGNDGGGSTLAWGEIAIARDELLVMSLLLLLVVLWSCSPHRSILGKMVAVVAVVEEVTGTLV